jgi:hypothetical protein
MKCFNRICILLIVFSNSLYAQKYINISGYKVNHLDKHQRKQGSWFYFHPNARLAVTCMYKDNSIASPVTFFDPSGDTSFVSYTLKDSVRLFEIFKQKNKYVGTYQLENGQPVFSFEEGVATDTSLTRIAIRYLNMQLPPVYMFAQSDFWREVASRMVASQIFRSRTIEAELVINSSGKVESVNFPQTMTILSLSEKEELAEIYKKMPRWQPAFNVNEDIPYYKLRVKHNNNTSWQVR